MDGDLFLSERRRARDTEERALVGTVTLGGAPAGAYTDGERRELPVFGPGGYRWKPAQGQQVLVLKTGADGELPCVAGIRTEAGDLTPGEVALEPCGGACGLKLGLDGRVRVSGELFINGRSLETLIQEYIGAMNGGES